MVLTQSPPVLHLLSHELRWQLTQALALGDLRVQELITLVDRPANLVSYHLRRLREGGLVHERRSAADARDVYYMLDLEQLRALYLASGAALHPALGEAPDTQAEKAEASPSPVRVLFLCTHNSARSQMAEALLRSMSKGSVECFSAGSRPGEVHPMAVQVLEERQISLDGQRSKHLDEFIEERFDYVITVCDRAREVCPVFPGEPEQIHWSFPDPAAVEGSAADRLQAFRDTASQLVQRLNFLLIVIDRKHGRST